MRLFWVILKLCDIFGCLLTKIRLAKVLHDILVGWRLIAQFCAA